MSQGKLSLKKGPGEKEQTEALTRTVIFDLLHLLCNLEHRQDLGRLQKSLSVLHTQISDLDGLYHRLGFSVVKQMDRELNDALVKYRKKKITRNQFAEVVHHLFGGALTMDELVDVITRFLKVNGMKDNEGKSQNRNYRSLSEEALAMYLEVSSGTIANQKKAHKPLQLRSVSENLPEVLGKLLDLPVSSVSRIARVIGQEIENVRAGSEVPHFGRAGGPTVPTLGGRKGRQS